MKKLYLRDREVKQLYIDEGGVGDTSNSNLITGIIIPDFYRSFTLPSTRAT